MSYEIEKQNNELANMSEQEIVNMIKDTTQLVANEKANSLSAAVAGARESANLTSNVEFWKWMGRNYKGSGIFDSNQAMLNYIAKGDGKEAWVAKQLQGKGYEWDWMRMKTSNPANIAKNYNAGDIATRGGTDVTETNLFTGQVKEYQMKAYAGKTNPDLHNTPDNATVVTNSEKAGIVKNNGYKTESFQDANKIKQSTNERMNQIKEGKAANSYNLQNVTGAMAKAGAVGCVIGMGVEAVASYKQWKSGQLTDEQYLKEIAKSGGDAGVTAAATAGIMVPVNAAIMTAGASTLIGIPVAIVVSAAVNKIVAPIFGRGSYLRDLGKAKYYQNFQNAYADMAQSMGRAAENYYEFVSGMGKQQETYNELQRRSMDTNKKLKDLYDSI